MKNTFVLLAVTASAIGLVSSQARAGLILTMEAPGVQATTVAGATTETFDGLAVGAFSGSTAVGTFSSGGSIVSGTASGGAYGGAFGTDFYAIGAQSGNTSATLTPPTSEHYFGMWWAAGDGQNQLDLFNGATLLGSFQLGNLLASLPAAYFGNPNNGLDSGEPFVYLNFITTGNDVITSVQFNNLTTASGFEMDNFSVLDRPIAVGAH